MRRLVAIPVSLIVLTAIASGCRDDGREMRPALPSQDGSVSTTSPPTSPAVEDDFFDTVVPDPAAPGGPIEVSTTVLGSATIAPLVPALTVTAPWRAGAAIDPRYTCKGANVSPALSWTDSPEGTQEIAITLIDQDAEFDHWTVTGIAPDITGIAENTLPEGAVAALNGAGATGYTGPCPPAGATHVYRITVHFLDRALLMSSGGTAAAMRSAIDDATFATAQVSGTFTGT
ncbi:MAG: YbhB/YbcL family Raf kinase inhibitor-like protein [Ilumatobacteraceae bacterium]